MVDTILRVRHPPYYMKLYARRARYECPAAPGPVLTWAVVLGLRVMGVANIHFFCKHAFRLQQYFSFANRHHHPLHLLHLLAIWVALLALLAIELAALRCLQIDH